MSYIIMFLILSFVILIVIQLFKIRKELEDLQITQDQILRGMNELPQRIKFT